ncbi:MAG: AAA family ATPase [Candidatus Nanoarchaeia archaeon]|nr:AAA family ATPase [Candidatus Nanoarchaeia archaeon]
MIIKKIRLNNIRSYLIEEIEFPEGSTLLSGDVGTGKSSILLAIEFALFGIRKGELSGDLLLRKGEDEGYVELFMEVENKDYIIKRTLKRTSSGVSQDSGYIISDGARREGTALELKQQILNILNYPKELLTKTKSLIYRYTVYTPQEEMKLILSGEKDARLDTLRKVFGIDKYKRINENSKIILTKIKEKQKEYAGFISDLNKKIDQKIDYEKEIQNINKEINLIKPRYETLNKEVNDKIKSIALYEEKIKEEQELRKKIELNNLKITSRIEKKERNDSRINGLILQVNEGEKEIITIDVEEVKKTIKFKRDVLDETQKELENTKNELSKLLAQEENSNKIKEDIENLNFCPLCKQEVNKEHKHKIMYEENNKLMLIGDKKGELIGKKAGFEKRIKDLLEEIDELKERQNKVELVIYKKKAIEEKIKEKTKLEEENELISKEVKILKESNEDSIKKLEDYLNINRNYEKEKLDLESLRKNFRDIEIRKVTLETQLNSITKTINLLDKEIDERIKKKEKLEYLSQLRTWIEESFINIISLIEKQVMLRVHYDFDILFQKWFDILMNNKEISISLDEEYSPKIIQNGHDIDYNYLSGGEKTAAALAYRLSLNQVINNLVSEIRTKDIIILDEPTDGFSSEQLDRIRLVLDELNIKQVIIVSHESKIESFVENVIRFNKENHISKIT